MREFLEPFIRPSTLFALFGIGVYVFFVVIPNAREKSEAKKAYRRITEKYNAMGALAGYSTSGDFGHKSGDFCLLALKNKKGFMLVTRNSNDLQMLFRRESIYYYQFEYNSSEALRVDKAPQPKNVKSVTLWVLKDSELNRVELLLEICGMLYEFNKYAHKQFDMLKYIKDTIHEKNTRISL